MRTDTTGTDPAPTTGSLGPEQRAELAATMAAAAAGDAAAPWALLEAFGDRIAACLRSLARADGLRIDDDLEGLLAEACLELADVAGSWRPDGGALPWTYAAPRLRAMLHRHAGPALVPLPPEDRADPRNWGEAAPGDDDPSLVVLARVADERGEPAVVALRDALGAACSPADGELVLRYLQQKAAGDPSPAHTVGAQLGRRPDAVRQAFRRARTRLRRLALAERRFRPLLALPFLAELDGPTPEPTGRAA